MGVMTLQKNSLEPKKYRHQQKIGDLFFTLPVLKDYCDTNNHHPCEIYLSPKYYTKKYGIRDHTIKSCKAMIPLLEVQYYIQKADIYSVKQFKKNSWKIDKNLKNVWWEGTGRHHRGEQYKKRHKKYGEHCQRAEKNESPIEWCDCGFTEIMNDPMMNVCKNIIHAFGKPSYLADKPWLEVPDPKQIAPVVISRSDRYKNYKFPWKDLWKRYKNKSIFIGLKHEWKLFCKQVDDKVPYYPTKDFLEVGQIIAGSKLFIGNQSAAYTVAEGLKHNLIQETSPRIPSSYFNRSNARYYLRRWYPCCSCGDPQCSDGDYCHTEIKPPWDCKRIHL